LLAVSTASLSRVLESSETKELERSVVTWRGTNARLLVVNKIVKIQMTEIIYLSLRVGDLSIPAKKVKKLEQINKVKGLLE